MHELESVLAACRRSINAGRPAMLATVVRVEGSAYRRPGTRMVLIAGEEPVGMISGGCLESDLLDRLGDLLASNRPAVVVYDMRSPDDVVWGLGLGCDGEVRVLLEPVLAGAAPAYLTFLERCERAREPGVLVTVFQATTGAGIEIGDRLAVDAHGAILAGERSEPLAHWFGGLAQTALHTRHSAVHVVDRGSARAEALVEFLTPLPALCVFGAGGDAVPVVRLARDVGWRVAVLDHRAGWARPERFPRASVHTVDYARLEAVSPVTIDGMTAAIVMTHHFLHDLELLAWLSRTPAFYIGMLGPRRRSAKLLHELSGRGRTLGAGERGRIHAPVGLDVGAESPAEIAVAVIAEICAVLAERQGGFLRERTAPLHDRGAARGEPWR